MKYYAGIGSRETPESILNAFEKLGKKLAEMGITLRSGRAGGADSAFEKGARSANGNCEIFIPWASFQKDGPLGTYPAIVFDSIHPEQKEAALNSVRTYHPAPDRLSNGAMKLMARNYCQIFGRAPQSPKDDFIVCWTKNGKACGGTGQAIRMAEDAGIKVFNAKGYEENPDAFVEYVIANI